MTLAEYVKKRNGVPLGSNKSLANMLNRSLGAGSFALFWKYWNPIWSYYLAKFFFKPLKTFLPSSLALIITFCASGLIHDFVIMLLRKQIALLFTPWFFLMALCVVFGEWIQLDYARFSWAVRALINVAIISACFILAIQLQI